MVAMFRYYSLGRLVPLVLPADRVHQTLIIPRMMQNLMLGIIAATFVRSIPEDRAAQGDINAGVTMLGFLLGVPTNMAFFNMVRFNPAVNRC